MKSLIYYFDLARNNLSKKKKKNGRKTMPKIKRKMKS